ncbi:MAG: hypothetical protein MAG581_02760 [Deltaproteobacteria bacterium]|jgi:hypothetical protein|nr:hypothetical protein [Deltaproteobacteria bacterium]
MEKEKGSNRRSFLRGALVAAGATSATIMTAGSAVGKAVKTASGSTGPVLYRRTKEAERYYKTLYT